MASVVGLWNCVAILFVCSKFLQSAGEVVSTKSYQTTTTHTANLNGMPIRPTSTFKDGIDKISKKGKTESPLSSVNTPNVSLETAHATNKVFIPLAPDQHHNNDKQGKNNNSTISTARTPYSKSHPHNTNNISERSTMSKTDLKSTSNVKIIKPTISTTNVHAFNKLNEITTLFLTDDSLRKTNIVPTQDPFVAQPNMTVTDLKQQKNKNVQNVSPTTPATIIETTTKTKMTESTKLGVTSTLLETVTFSGERTSIKSKDTFVRNPNDAAINKPFTDSNNPIETTRYSNMESFSEFPTKKSIGVTTNFEEAPDDSSVPFSEQERKVKNSENEEHFKQTTLEINKEIQTKWEITKSSLLPSTLPKQVTSSEEKGNFKTIATLVINKNDDTMTMLSSYNTTPMGTHNVLLSNIKPSMVETTSFEHTQHETSVSFLEQNTKNKIFGNEEIIDQTTFKTNVELLNRSEIQSTVLPNLPYEHFTSSGEMGNFKFTATLERHKKDDTSNSPSSSKTTPMGTNIELFSDTKTPIRVTTSLEHTQENTIIPFLEQNTEIKKSENEEIFDQTTFETNVETQTRSEIKQSTVLPNLPYEHFTSSGEMGNFKFTATLERHKKDDTSNSPSSSKTTPMGTNIELFSDTKTPIRVTTSLEHTQENTIVPFLEQNTEIKKSENEESFDQTTFETNVETQTRSEIKQSTVTPNHPYEHFTSSEKLGNFKLTATLGRNKNDDTSNSPSNSNTTPIGTKNELLRDTKTSTKVTTSLEHTQEITSAPFFEKNIKITKSKKEESFDQTTLETKVKTQIISEIKQSTLLHSILSEHFTSPGEKNYLKTSTELGIQTKDGTSKLPTIYSITSDNSTSSVTNDETSVINEDLLSPVGIDDGFNSSGDIDYVTTVQTSIVNCNVKSSNEEVNFKRKNVTDIGSINSNVVTTTKAYNTTFAGGNGNSNTASTFFSNPAVSHSKSVITSTLSSTLSTPKHTSIISLPITTISTTVTGTRRTIKKHNVAHFNIQFDVKQEKTETKPHQTSPISMVTPASTIFDDERSASRNHKIYSTKRREKTYESIKSTPTIITSLPSSTKATKLAPKLGSSNALSLSAIKYHIYILIIFIMNMFVT